MNVCVHPDCEEEGKNRRFINEQIHFFCNAHVEEYEADRQVEASHPMWKTG